jgi:hypothetical protein
MNPNIKYVIETKKLPDGSTLTIHKTPDSYTVFERRHIQDGKIILTIDGEEWFLINKLLKGENSYNWMSLKSFYTTDIDFTNININNKETKIPLGISFKSISLNDIYNNICRKCKIKSCLRISSYSIKIQYGISISNKWNEICKSSFFNKNNPLPQSNSLVASIPIPRIGYNPLNTLPKEITTHIFNCFLHSCRKKTFENELSILYLKYTCHAFVQLFATNKCKYCYKSIISNIYKSNICMLCVKKKMTDYKCTMCYHQITKQEKKDNETLCNSCMVLSCQFNHYDNADDCDEYDSCHSDDEIYS